ncbi:MAG: 50S ribosomal protein L10 [Anaerolineae bacterium]
MHNTAVRPFPAKGVPCEQQKVFACKWQRLLLLKGGEYPLAISKQRKEEVLDQYQDWLKRSQAVILVEYTGANMKMLDALRAKVREVGRRVPCRQEYAGPPRFCR